MKRKKLISSLLSIVMLISAAPSVIYAENETTSITVQSVTAAAGTTVDVPVVVQNNPGILGATLKFTYDPTLTLQSVTNGSAFSSLTMTKPGVFTSPCKVMWDGQDLDEDDIKDGNILILKFAVPNDATEGTTYNISASYEDGDFVDYNLDSIGLSITNGAITVVNIKYGDLDGNELVNNTDVIRMRRHIAGGYDQTINEIAADVNLDTNINTTDVIILRRFIAGGYGIDELPYVVCKHELQHFDAIAATETDEGNKEYWECTKCHKYFSDAEGTKVTTWDKIVEPIIEKDEYTIQYKCDMVPQATDTYRPAEGKVLPTPVLDKYTFVGWSDKDGKIWNDIPVGTKGNITLYANWASHRNMAIPAEKLAEPAIMEDSQNGLIYFSYKIGKIINVPLYQMSEFLTANGVETEITTTKSTSQTVQTSQEIAKTLSEATTNSTSWSLSQNWNNVTEVSEKYIEENQTTREEAEILARNSSGSYTVGYASGGTSGTTSTSDSSYAISSNNSKHREFEHQNDNSVVTTVDHKFNAEVGASFPISVVNVNAKVGYGYENNKVTTQSSSDRYAGTDDWSNSENYAGSQSNTSSNSKTWNSTSSSTSSWGEEKTTSVKQAVSEMVTREYNTNNSYELGGSEGETIGKSTVTGEENKLSSTVLYDTTEITTEAVTYRTTGNTHGGYRIVLAGTLQVYAVVIYDIGTGEYSVQTYSVLGDGSENDAPKPYLDYCWEGNQFDDYETSVIPFEIPYVVNGYVNSLVAKTDGLQFNPDTGRITRFNNESDTELIYIPTYISVDNGDGTDSFTRITTLNKELFKNNTNIKAVRIGNGVTEIPEGAFEGCTNLKDVYAPSVTKIGDRAFAGCESLNSFTISEDITEVGTDAFEGVSSINAVASSLEVAQAVAQSGASNIVLNISAIPDNEKSGIEFNVGAIESFELRGGNKEYPGLSITSDANSTVLNRITFTQNTRIPIELSSETVTLDQVSVDCVGYALVLKADETNLIINRTTNNLLSSSGIAALCKNITITDKDNGVDCGMQADGDILVCGDYSGESMVTFYSGEFKTITSEEYENYLSAHRVSFDANGGNVNAEDKLVAYNGTFGELPVASRDYYTFDGWYTEPEDGEGEEITAESIMTSLVDMTLYAHWRDNDVSEWVPNAEMPEDAQLIATKYKYDLTSYTSSSSSTFNDWTPYGSTWVWSDYGNWSGWQDSYVGGSDSRKVETRSVVASSNYKHVYRFYKWGFSSTDYSYSYSGGGRSYFVVDVEYWPSSEGQRPVDKSGSTYRWWTGNNWSAVWYESERDEWVSDNYKTQYRYADRSKIYTYYYKKTQNDLELDYYPTYALLSSVSESNHPTGDYMSNVQEYVQYRKK